jgi:hypothetical protein
MKKEEAGKNLEKWPKDTTLLRIIEFQRNVE